MKKSNQVNQEIVDYLNDHWSDVKLALDANYHYFRQKRLRDTWSYVMAITMWLLFIGFFAFIMGFAIWGASKGVR